MAQFQDKLSEEIAMYIFYVPQSTQAWKIHQKDKFIKGCLHNLFVSVSFTATFINIFHVEIGHSHKQQKTNANSILINIHKLCNQVMLSYTHDNFILNS